MVYLLLTGVAAGLASALLAAGAAAGSALAVPLFYLSPLPVMIAGIAFSPLAAFVAVMVGGAGLGLGFGGTFLLTYMVSLGGPAFALSYAAMLARPDSAGRDGLVWFPVGGLVLLSAAVSTLAVIIALFAVAGDYESYRRAVIAAFEALLSGQVLPGAQPTDPAAVGAIVARLLPGMAAVMSMVSQLVCLYLAARAALISGRLRRPWPTLSAFRLPPVTSLVLAVAIALSMAGAMVGLSASAAAATLVCAYALAGFAVVHSVTIGHSARFLILGALWLTTAVLGWPVLAMAVLGFVDAMFDFRSRMGTGQSPPAANDR
ncbi:DUF2232 domain-containing protein [Xanthobacter autotrophicus]|uniref:DUF2232 domain-containing protein n=1 Tax=Xanthobacter TaxID=279 RepID=UPI001E46530C|nr:DUF2232 domain-containing protein [Xanthobacter autotrophicus]UDQ87311.1 DUF2232 domain-containing protein [Xanthobacter autotrophicus]